MEMMVVNNDIKVDGCLGRKITELKAGDAPKKKNMKKCNRSTPKRGVGYVKKFNVIPNAKMAILIRLVCDAYRDAFAIWRKQKSENRNHNTPEGKLFMSDWNSSNALIAVYMWVQSSLPRAIFKASKQMDRAKNGYRIPRASFLSCIKKESFFPLLQRNPEAKKNTGIPPEKINRCRNQ